ncbi:MAG: citrate/2-methylcitrate synthase [Oceanicoccus sp.]
MNNTAIYSADLAGIEVGETAISDVNGTEGILSYRGQPIEMLAGQPFWQVVWLVLFGTKPTPAQELSIAEFVGIHGVLDKSELALLSAVPAGLHPMLVLQGMVPLLNLHAKSHVEDASDVAESGLIIAAKIPSIIAAYHRMEEGETLICANPDMGFHENFLMQFNGRLPTSEQTKIVDAVQILQMEHSFNAGTFAGRVCASTKAPIQSCIAASIGTLFGVLHGGADQAALEMADSIGDPARAKAYVDFRLSNKEKIMGMGHREYRVLDPRAKILKPMASNLCQQGEAKRLFETLCAVEDACQVHFAAQGKEIRANVEFYKGAVFYQLGIPPRYFTAMFSMARVYGYIAHYLEFSENSQLIRPRARYVGIKPE